LKLTFWEHVHALRATLLRSFFFFLISLIVSFFFSDFISSWALSPLFQKKDLLQRIPVVWEKITSINTTPSLVTLPSPARTPFPLPQGVEQVDVSTFLLQPNATFYVEKPRTLYLLSPIEGFLNSLKISFWTSIILSSPFCTFFLLQFFSPALKKRERKFFFFFFIFSLVCIGGGIVFAYYISLPTMAHFFSSYNELYGVNAWTFGACLNFCLWIFLGHGMAFEFLAITLLCIHLGVLSAKTLILYRRYSIVAIFIISALLTPPDVLSQILLALPLLFFYEGSIFYAKFVKKIQKINILN
jgi:sec-independent protein translocase protein TatC